MSEGEGAIEAPRKRHIDVLGRRMAVVEMGSGAPILFQHGNPTSSWLWRNIMPRLAGQGRCIAVDLLGMGDSDRVDAPGPGRYSFAEQSRHLDAAWAALGVDRDAVLVLHDWGSALGFDWARRHPQAVQGIAFMEAIVRPLLWDEWPESARRMFQGFRSPAGEAMILRRNLFIEQVLPSSILRQLTDAEMNEYRRPFLEAGEARRPMLDWPRQLPIDGEPEEVVERVRAYADWLAGSPAPKLFVNAEPGAILIGAQREFCRSWPNLREVTVAGSHFIQEDSPQEIAAALADFVRELRGA